VCHRIGGTTHETRWVAIEQPDGTLGSTGWEASVQWVDPRLALKIERTSCS
jgi:hypothetical protein